MAFYSVYMQCKNQYTENDKILKSEINFLSFEIDVGRSIRIGFWQT